MARKAAKPAPDTLSDAERIHAYKVGLRVRATITQCLTEMRKGTVRFWIGGPGEEVHGTATALAMHHFDREVLGDDTDGWTCALFPHYRSDALAAMLSQLRGNDDFTGDYFRQALSRATDPMTAGRQMVMHVADPERGLMPAQSPLGMNLGKAAGYARGQQVMGQPGVTVAVCGDGTTSTSDFHECFTAAGVWQLPMLVIVTDNEIAISVTPDEGRGVKDYRSYAAAFNAHHLECDGGDLDDTFERTLEALRWVRENGRTCLLHAHVPRLRGHSSSDGAIFRYDVTDPILSLGEKLVGKKLIKAGAAFRRKSRPKQLDYFDDHHLGALMKAEVEQMRATLETVRAEPAPVPGDEFEFTLPPLPAIDDPPAEGTTAVQINEALNLCLHRIADQGNMLAWGQDIGGDKGGVFKVTRGLAQRHPKHVVNAPINEPMILGTAIGAAHHQQLCVMPEIQFGDYALNCLHWLVHGGNIYWGSGGRMPLNVTLRTPVGPVAGGAIYHSMSVDGFFTPVPGWVIIAICTGYDAYGLLRTAAEYPGPVLFLEPKSLYRRAVGPQLPGEPDAAGLRKTRRASGESLLNRDDLTAIEDYRIPFGKAAVRRTGGDLTIVAWASAALLAEDAAKKLADDGIDAEVIDLRTLSPWDRDMVLASVRKTGRLLVAHQDRPFGGFGREIQATVHEQLDGVASLCVGMRNVPAVGQAKELEDHTILSVERIADAAREVHRRPTTGFAENDNAWVQYAPTRRRT